MVSPIKKVNVGATLPAGAYYFSLISVDETQQKEKKWAKGPGGKNIGVETGNMEDVLSFRFATTHPQLGDAFVQTRVRPTNAPNGGLVKLLKSMAPGELTSQIVADPEYLWSFAKSLIGRMFIVTVEPKDVYNNLKGVSPAPQAHAAPPPPPPQMPQPAQAQLMPPYMQPPVPNTPQITQPSIPIPTHFQGMPQAPAFVPPPSDDDAPPIDDDDIPF